MKDKKFSELTGKLHLLCPYAKKSGICTHVVIKDGVCYRSCECMVLCCKYNSTQGDIEKILSVTW